MGCVMNYFFLPQVLISEVKGCILSQIAGSFYGAIPGFSLV